MRVFLLFAAVLPVAAATAQGGAVAGRVTCADTNAPARFADVTLMPVPAKLPPGEKPVPLRMTIYTTALDGSFSAADVAPGRYYVIAHLNGYRSPTNDFEAADLQSTEETVMKRVAEEIPVVTVMANQTSTASVRLRRGGSVSGTVRFDDGTPFVTKATTLWRRSMEGKWVRLNRADSTGFDSAEYSYRGLAPGEYRVSVDLRINDRVTDTALGQSGTTTYTYGYILSLYDGDTFRQSDGRSFQLHEGEAIAGRDFSVPVSRLHSVAGAVVAEKTGAPVNSGYVTLADADGHTVVTTAIRFAEAAFRFPFVPEGTYTVKVSEAKQVRHDPVQTEKNDRMLVPPYTTVDLETFGSYKGTLIVQTDTSGVLLPVAAAVVGKGN